MSFLDQLDYNPTTLNIYDLISKIKKMYNITTKKYTENAAAFSVYMKDLF